jgi:hypothetical protein
MEKIIMSDNWKLVGSITIALVSSFLLLALPKWFYDYFPIELAFMFWFIIVLIVMYKLVS